MRRFGVEVAAHRLEGASTSRRRSTAVPGRSMSKATRRRPPTSSRPGAIGGGPVRVEGRRARQHPGRRALRRGAGAHGRDGVVRRELDRSVQDERQSCAPIDLDLNHIPDAAMTAAVLALFADGPSTLRNIASWRVKETDRIAAMATELRKLGAAGGGGQRFPARSPRRRSRPDVAIDTYDDHRMAMCFSLVALGGVPVRSTTRAAWPRPFPTTSRHSSSIVE